jgi:hypothetical protein
MGWINRHEFFFKFGYISSLEYPGLRNHTSRTMTLIIHVKGNDLPIFINVYKVS